MPTANLRTAALALLLGAVLPACSDGCNRHPTKGHDTVVIGDSAVTADTGPIAVVPPKTAAWQRSESQTPGSITFNELYYHAPTDEGLEWIELHNPMALDVDLSGWSLSGGVSYRFPDKTVVAAGGYLVVAADPSRVTGALGPYTGTLADGGERLDLDNNFGRLLDTISYGDDDPWPVQPDGSGLTLAKIDADAASDHAENWTFSAQLGGTPGEANALDATASTTTVDLVALDATWTYDVSGAYPAADWTQPGYDDSAWASGQATFYAGAAQADATATVRVTADNYYGVYLGQADGTDLRLIGESDASDWTTVESVDVTVSPTDQLYIAAWEAAGDNGGPQMTIGEVQVGADVVGTDAAAWEWTIGPRDGCPGLTPTDPPPTEADLGTLVADANAAASWAPPAVQADRTSDPWGWATSASFADGTDYIWADTFGDVSVTNTENTYALFRSTGPLLGSRGTTDLATIPTTTTFRTTFTLDADPAATTLSADYLVDDGAIFYLNGVEVLRVNMPAGAVDASTLASTSVADAAEAYADLPTTSLVRGENVLTVELHQAEPTDPDLTFACALTARVTHTAAEPTIVLNEVAAASTTPFWVELLDATTASIDTTGLVLASSAGGEIVLPTGSLGPGELVDVPDVGFSVHSGDLLYLYSADRSALLDAVRVGDGLRGRADASTAGTLGPWRVPTEATPETPNVIDTTDDVVINEIQYDHEPLSQDGTPVTANPQEWIELYNRGSSAVDLGGWQLDDAVAYDFPTGTVLQPGGYLVVAGDAASMRSEHADIPIVGDFSGTLSHSSDRILLLDARGNPADEVRYYDGGRWPAAADGGGSTLELRDPRADNSAPEAWAASNEGTRSTWATYTYRGTAEPSAVGPDGQWDEFVMGLLDSGEVLIDDLSVIQDPDGAAVQVVQNGTFDAATSDGGADHWRLLGDHRHSKVVPDPDDPSNNVLDLVATGATEHMHNHAETTLLAPIATTTYAVSFRARWISGSNQLNSRLYFNRLPHTTLIAQPAQSGTPGAPNSTRVDTIGPTFTNLSQDVAVPAAGQPVQVSIGVADPDGVQGVTLWSAVDGTAFSGTAMTESSPGLWTAPLGPEAAGTLVQMYVEAVDDLGATSRFPAAGADSRALVKWDDGLEATNGLHNFRLLMTKADSDWLLDPINVMSDDALGATVVYDESKIYYDVGVRTKGSERGRPEVPRLGFGVSFHSEQPFRGSHSSVLIDRSEGVGYGQREMLMRLVMNHAGCVSGEYNDLIQVLTPRLEHTGAAELQLDRFSSLMLDNQFTNGSSGGLYKYELVYYPLTTDDGTAEGYKLPQPDSVIGTALTDLGDDKESYRWNFLVQNNERVDDFDRLMEMNKTFALADADFLAQAPEMIDVDQWLRAFAFATLSGAVDNYGGDGSEHNAEFYVRPDDQRLLYFPHDLDYYGGYTGAVVANNDLARLLEDPVNRRTYYGHLNDIISTTFNGSYLAPWCAQMAALLPAQDIAGHCQFIADRADWVMNGSPDAITTRYPPLAFQITTGGGADFSVAATSVVLDGEGWIDVRQIALDGATAPLDVTWLDDRNWEVTVPLVSGANTLDLVATNLEGVVVGTDAIVVTSTAGP